MNVVLVFIAICVHHHFALIKFHMNRCADGIWESKKKIAIHQQIIKWKEKNHQKKPRTDLNKVKILQEYGEIAFIVDKYYFVLHISTVGLWFFTRWLLEEEKDRPKKKHFFLCLSQEKQEKDERERGSIVLQQANHIANDRLCDMKAFAPTWKKDPTKPSHLAICDLTKIDHHALLSAEDLWL